MRHIREGFFFIQLVMGSFEILKPRPAEVLYAPGNPCRTLCGAVINRKAVCHDGIRSLGMIIMMFMSWRPLWTV